MGINLKKGQRVELKKPDGQALQHVMVGLGWDPIKSKGGGLRGLFKADIDCDASAFLCENGVVARNKDIVYFAHLKHKSGCVRHMGDNLTGAGEGDDEQIFIDLEGMPPEFNRVIIVVNIFQARQRKQHFGMVGNAFIRLVDRDTGQEILRYELTEEYPDQTAMIFGELYRHNGAWKFAAIGQGTTDNSVQELAARFK